MVKRSQVGINGFIVFHRISSYRSSSYFIASYFIVFHRIVFQRISSYRIVSYFISLYSIVVRGIVFHRISLYLFHRIVFHRISWYRIVSYFIVFHLPGNSNQTFDFKHLGYELRQPCLRRPLLKKGKAAARQMVTRTVGGV